MRKSVNAWVRTGGRPDGRGHSFNLPANPFGPHGHVRLQLVSLVALLWFGLVVLRLADLQILQQDDLAKRADRQQMGEVDILPKRGGILDRNLEELALSTPAQSIGVFSDRVHDKRAMARELAVAAGVEENDLYRRMDERGGFQWVKRLATLAEYQRISALDPPGDRSFLHFETENRRYYPHGSVAAHVLGMVGLDHHGQAGLELKFDSRLRGEPGLRVLQYDGSQRRYGAQVIRPAVPGDDIVLDLDLRIQSLVHLELERAVRETRSQAGTVVLMRPDTGEIVAMSSWPRFDPNSLSRKSQDLENLRNFAISHLVEPGSTFKVLTAVAALEEGLVATDEVFDCEMGAIWIHRRRIRDHHPYGLLTMPEILMKSSNVGIIKIGYRIGSERMHDYIRRFGFGEPTGIRLPGEVAGLVRPVDRWSGSSLASLAMGQEIGVSAVQMARLFAAVANGGMLVEPRIVRGIREQGGGVVPSEPRPGTRVVSPATAATMQSILERVVQDGTGRLARIPGYRVAGKTGTAQMINPESGSYRDGAYLASFCGFAPVNDPALVGVAMLYDPRGEHYYGGRIAAPLFSAAMKRALRILDVEPSQPAPGRPASPAPVPDTVLADFVEDRDARTDDSELQTLAADPATGSPAGPVPAPRTDARAPSVAAEPPATASAGPSEGDLAMVPDMRGLTLREALELGVRLGIRIEPVGSGIGHSQSPQPNGVLAEGQTLRVRFSHSPETEPVAGRDGREDGG